MCIAAGCEIEFFQTADHAYLCALLTLVREFLNRSNTNIDRFFSHLCCHIALFDERVLGYFEELFHALLVHLWSLRDLRHG